MLVEFGVDGAPAAIADVLADRPLPRKVVENHLCEGWKLMKALLYSVGITRWRKCESVKNTKNCHAQREHPWRPPGVVNMSLLPPGTPPVEGGRVTIEERDFTISEAMAQLFAAEGTRAQQKLVAALRAAA